MAREAHTSERHLSHARTFTRFLHARTYTSFGTHACDAPGSHHKERRTYKRTYVRTYVSTHPPKMSPHRSLRETLADIPWAHLADSLPAYVATTSHMASCRLCNMFPRVHANSAR